MRFHCPATVSSFRAHSGVVKLSLIPGPLLLLLDRANYARHAVENKKSTAQGLIPRAAGTGAGMNRGEGESAHSLSCAHK